MTDINREFEKEARRLIAQHVNTWGTGTHTNWDRWGAPTEKAIFDFLAEKLAVAREEGRKEAVELIKRPSLLVTGLKQKDGGLHIVVASAEFPDDGQVYLVPSGAFERASLIRP